MNFVEIDMKEHTGESSMSELQSHDYFEIYFLLSGTRRVFIKDRIFTVSAPAVCVIPPFCMHKTEGGACRRINVNVSADVLSEVELSFLNSLSEKNIFSLELSEKKLFLPLLESAAACESTPQSAYLSESYLHILLHLLKKDCISSRELDFEIGKRKEVVISKIIEYINSNYREDFSIDELCHSFFISKNNLCAKFRKIMKCSVMQYLTFVRISKAKELLASTSKPMEAIAEECGFSSANYFCLIFKKNVGIAPTYYRKAK